MDGGENFQEATSEDLGLGGSGEVSDDNKEEDIEEEVKEKEVNYSYPNPNRIKPP